MITIPPSLRPGDTIAIVCPAGYMPLERAQSCIDTLQQWGYRVRVGKTLGSAAGVISGPAPPVGSDTTQQPASGALPGPSSDAYFSGSDADRLADLQEALDDPEIKAILCGRGGYGLSRIIDHIDFSRFENRPKWVIGFSDITILHSHLYRQYAIASLHAPMAGAFTNGGVESPGVQSLRRALTGERAVYSCPSHPFNRMGSASGGLAGGNLSLLAHLVGTASDTDTTGRLLFLEDVGENLYHIDRMLHQLKRSGKLDRLAGLMIGGFTELKRHPAAIRRLRRGDHPRLYKRV